MGKEKEEGIPYDRAVGDLLGIVNCLLIVSDVKEFRTWIRQYHSSNFQDSHLSGYVLVFDTLLRLLISRLERDVSLGLTSDDVFNRATFKGIAISKLPNTCEKTVLIKNLQHYIRAVVHSDSWDSLDTAMHRVSSEVLAPFNDIKQACSLNRDYPLREMEYAIRCSSMFQTYIFLNDTSRGIPHGYVRKMLDIQESCARFRHSAPRTLHKAFLGYKYTVQFLWYQLLGSDFGNSVVSDIHTSTDWRSFDNYFDRIKSEVIEPLDKSTRGVMGYDSFILVDRSPKSYLAGLLEEKGPESPLSVGEDLARAFLWYPIQLIDSSDYSFSGAPAVILLLMGMIQIKRRSTDISKAKVIRLVHGAVEEHRRSYSYAVLTELSGYISDASGWLLFYDCCDDRGSTSGLFREVESLLSRYTKNAFIDITSISIDKARLLEFVGKAAVTEAGNT